MTAAGLRVRAAAVSRAAFTGVSCSAGAAKGQAPLRPARTAICIRTSTVAAEASETA